MAAALDTDDERRSASRRPRLGVARRVELVGLESAGPRSDLNEAFLTHAGTAESRMSLAENAKRYQTEALFIANGQRANGSKEHQYPELTKLFDDDQQAAR